MHARPLTAPDHLRPALTAVAEMRRCRWPSFLTCLAQEALPGFLSCRGAEGASISHSDGPLLRCHPGLETRPEPLPLSRPVHIFFFPPKMCPFPGQHLVGVPVNHGGVGKRPLLSAPAEERDWPHQTEVCLLPRRGCGGGRGARKCTVPACRGLLGTGCDCRGGGGARTGWNR